VPSRRKTREFVLQVLYAADARKEDPLDVFEFLTRHFETHEDDDLNLDKITKEYAYELVDAVSKDIVVIDRIIAYLSHHWKLHRIDRVDRNILRMAIAELAGFPEIPGRVILNEAIEIGKKYGTEQSPAFINGILDKLHSIMPRPSDSAQLKDLVATLDQSNTTG
jgi:transcription antitermination protein NusB